MEVMKKRWRKKAPSKQHQQLTAKKSNESMLSVGKSSVGSFLCDRFAFLILQLFRRATVTPNMDRLS